MSTEERRELAGATQIELLIFANADTNRHDNKNDWIKFTIKSKIIFLYTVK